MFVCFLSLFHTEKKTFIYIHTFHYICLYIIFLFFFLHTIQWDTRCHQDVTKWSMLYLWRSCQKCTAIDTRWPPWGSEKQQRLLRRCLLFDNNRGLWMRAVCPCGGCVWGWGVSHVPEGLGAWAALDEGGGEHECESDPGAARLFSTAGYRDTWTASSRSGRCWIILQYSGIQLLDARLTPRTVRPQLLSFGFSVVSPSVSLCSSEFKREVNCTWEEAQFTNSNQSICIWV